MVDSKDPNYGSGQSGSQAHDEQLEELMRHEFSRLGTTSSPREEQGSRRRLLLIYIHGFLGSEDSFRAFPAHVHSLLAILLQETHVVHSKIYPRYKSKQYIKVARDGFSKWLDPHESATTDVVLLGHSMGGLISAEVVLMPGSETSSNAMMHRILGTLSFDVPYLGMHPGVVRSGLASIFSPPEEPKDKYNPSGSPTPNLETASLASDGVLDSSDSSFWESQDGNFNARFSNDVVLPVRKFWQSVAHFVHKHGTDIAHATHSMVNSHIEFMSAMSNSKELRERYTKIRMLEEDNEALRKSVIPGRRMPPRVRFANYYTVSTGRPKPVTMPQGESASSDPTNDADADIKTADKTEDQPQRVEEAPESSTDKAVEALISASTETATQLPPFGEVKAVSETSSDVQSPNAEPSQPSDSKADKPLRQGTFCVLPPKDSHGQRDPTWIRMFMEDVDEVGAHCGMFFVDDRYERFVGDVAGRIEDWVKNDLSLRAAQTDFPPD